MDVYIQSTFKHLDRKFPMKFKVSREDEDGSLTWDYLCGEGTEAEIMFCALQHVIHASSTSPGDVWSKGRLDLSEVQGFIGVKRRVKIAGDFHPRPNLYHSKTMSFEVVGEDDGWGCPVAIRAVVLDEGGDIEETFYRQLPESSMMTDNAREQMERGLEGSVDCPTVNDLRAEFKEFYSRHRKSANIVTRTSSPGFVATMARLREDGLFAGDMPGMVVKDIGTLAYADPKYVLHDVARPSMIALLSASIYRKIRMQQTWKDV